MNNNKFKELYSLLIKAEEYVNKLIKLNIDLFESPLYEAYGKFWDELLKANFDEKTVDRINAYIWGEQVLNNTYPTFDELLDHIKCSKK